MRRIHPLSVTKPNNFCLGIKDIEGSQASSFFARSHFIDVHLALFRNEENSEITCRPKILTRLRCQRWKKVLLQSDKQILSCRIISFLEPKKHLSELWFRLISYMQNEIYSYSFPLFENAYVLAFWFRMHSSDPLKAKNFCWEEQYPLKNLSWIYSIMKMKI